jgi:acyl carrier protein
MVAGHLGVEACELGSRVSLRDDLAADSLDLVELALVLEREFAISVPDRVLDGVRSYGDLVDTIVDLVLERTRDQRRNAEQPPRFWAQLVSEEVSAGTLACSGLLTPYTAETLAQDARMAGSGAHLDITVARGTTDVDFARVSSRFAHLAARGVRVDIRRHDRGVVVDAAIAGEPPAATA